MIVSPLIILSSVHEWAKFEEKDVDGSSTLAVLNDEAASKKNSKRTGRYPFHTTGGGGGRADIDHLAGASYMVSKLIDVFITRQLALLPAAKDIIVNCVNVSNTQTLCF